MELPDELKEIIGKLEKLHPVSIFLYGSRSRNDFLVNSDYEIGVFFSASNMVDEDTLRQLIAPDSNHYHIYPYEVSSFEGCRLSIPFEESIFVRSVILSGKTLWGKVLIENIVCPPITVVSLAREVKFQIGRASDALVCYRQGYTKIAAHLFVKSCLWGTRCLIILRQCHFPITYHEVVKCASDLSLKEYGALPMLALTGRQTGIGIDKKILLDNIWYLNRLVESQIMDLYRGKGDVVVLP